MSLLMLKTKNLSWQDHTLNIEAMLAPLRSTLLMNKHKTLDTKFDQEKALYQRQRDACIKDFVVEKRLIERRRQKILNRKKEIMQEIRSQSALEHAQEKTSKSPRADSKERSFSAPSDRRVRRDVNKKDDPKGVADITSALPRLALKHTPLFGGNPLRPRLFLETGITASNSQTPGTASSSTTIIASTTAQNVISGPRIEHDVKSKKTPKPYQSTTNNRIFITGDGQSLLSTTPSTDRRSKTPRLGEDSNYRKFPHQPSHQRLSSGAYFSKPGKIAGHENVKVNKDTPTTVTNKTNQRPGNKRAPNVTFLGLLNNEVDDDEDDNNNNNDGRITVELKPKTVEDKVREFLKELDAFNSRPPTAVGEDDDSISVFSSVRSRDVYTKQQPLVANRYQTLTLDKKLLEKAFDRYIEKRSHDDLLKAMKLAAKMKAHIRQARNTSLVPTMAAVKSSRTFLKLLKRQQRKEKQSQGAL